MRLEANQDHLICDYCGSIHFPDAGDDGVHVLGVPADDKCPVCAIPLVHASLDGQRILYCQRCRGMLIDMAHFAPLVADLRSRREASGAMIVPVNSAELNEAIRCPRCGGDMDRHIYGGGGNVVIDACEQCELNWLDHGELDRIVRVPDHQYTVSLET